MIPCSGIKGKQKQNASNWAQKFFPGEQYIIGDQAYQLVNWLLKKYQDNDRVSENERRFNKHLSGKRQLIEQAFEILKGRFRKLKMMDIDIVQDIPELVVAACTLHNICCENEDDVEEFLEYVDDVSGEQLCGCTFGDGSAGNVNRDKIMRKINT
ncbi:unnamed protein product [Mytilus coruscus]|uniref:DDE Tnp4 domain-containing protein n=1 Tax=Mytilus coruscus TaxID=42192 RepID=A0A6J8E100_MYTCO|nr:unnamed protein product [Mytilus coruscus]